MNRFTKISLTAVAAALVLSACSSSTASTPQTLPANVALEVHAVHGLHFDKNAYEATAGDIVVGYVNDDTIQHSLIVVQDGTKVANFALAVHKKNDTDSGTVNLPAGNYVIMCSVPGHQNMKADLTVK